MQTKKLFLIVALLCAVAMNANSQNGTPVPMNPFPIQPGNGGNPRSPIFLPVLYLDGYTLTASDNTVGSTIQLLDEDDNVVFSTYVYVEGDIALPTTLEGTFTIMVFRDDETFVGEIEL